MASNPFLLAPEVNANPPAERFVVSLPALRAGSATEDFPASAPASWRTGSPATAACSSWRSRWWKPCRARSQTTVGDPFRPRRPGAAYSRRYRGAAKGPARERWLPGNLWVKAGAGPTPSTPRWRLTVAAGSWPSALPTRNPSVLRGDAAPATGQASLRCWISPARRIFHQHTFGWVKAAAKQIEQWVKQSLHLSSG